MSSRFSRSSHACSRSRHLSGLATFELEIARGLNRGSFRVQLALREAWVFERFVGTNLTAMWRWLPTGPVDADPAETRQTLSTVSTVREWLTWHRTIAKRRKL